MPTGMVNRRSAKGRGVVPPPPPPRTPQRSGGSANLGGRPRREHISIGKYLNISDTSATMPTPRAITKETRVIDLTLDELLEALLERLGQVVPLGEKNRAEPEALLDTWAAAQLLGIGAKHDPGLEPPRGTPAWKTWRDHSQAVRDDIAHRFQQLLARRPELARLARYEGRRRFFVRADLTTYLASLAPARRSRR